MAIPDIELGDNLRTYRRKRGFTQNQFARRCGVDEQTYRSWENGKRRPSDVVVAGLAQLLDVPVSRLDPDQHVLASNSFAA